MQLIARRQQPEPSWLAGGSLIRENYPRMQAIMRILSIPQAINMQEIIPRPL